MKSIASTFNALMHLITGFRAPDDSAIGFRIQRIIPEGDSWTLGADGWCEAPLYNRRRP